MIWSVFEGTILAMCMQTDILKPTITAKDGWATHPRRIVWMKSKVFFKMQEQVIYVYSWNYIYSNILLYFPRMLGSPQLELPIVQYEWMCGQIRDQDRSTSWDSNEHLEVCRSQILVENLTTAFLPLRMRPFPKTPNRKLPRITTTVWKDLPPKTGVVSYYNPLCQPSEDRRSDQRISRPSSLPGR